MPRRLGPNAPRLLKRVVQPTIAPREREIVCHAANATARLVLPPASETSFLVDRAPMTRRARCLDLPPDAARAVKAAGPSIAHDVVHHTSLSSPSWPFNLDKDLSSLGRNTTWRPDMPIKFSTVSDHKRVLHSAKGIDAGSSRLWTPSHGVVFAGAQYSKQYEAGLWQQRHGTSHRGVDVEGVIHQSGISVSNLRSEPRKEVDKKYYMGHYNPRGQSGPICAESQGNRSSGLADRGSENQSYPSNEQKPVGNFSAVSSVTTAEIDKPRDSVPSVRLLDVPSPVQSIPCTMHRHGVDGEQTGYRCMQAKSHFSSLQLRPSQPMFSLPMHIDSGDMRRLDDQGDDCGDPVVSDAVGEHDRAPSGESSDSCANEAKQMPPSSNVVADGNISASLLEYQIRDDMLETPENQGYFSHDLYKNAEGRTPQVHYCRTSEEAENTAKLFLNSSVIGLDLEWKSRYSKNEIVTATDHASLLQLANERDIALFHLALFPPQPIQSLIPPSLRKVLEAKDILKVGVNIKADCTRLRKHLEAGCNSVLDLTHLHRVTSAEADRKMRRSLASLVQEHLRLPLAKDHDVRTSDWSQALDDEQLRYAAADAYCAVHLFDVMNRKRLARTPVSAMPPTFDSVVVLEKCDADEGPLVSEVPARSALTEAQTEDAGSDDEPQGSPPLSTVVSEEDLTKEQWVYEYVRSIGGKENLKTTEVLLGRYAAWRLSDKTLVTTFDVCCVLNAIRDEDLPFDVRKVGELLQAVPSWLLDSRYPKLMHELRHNQTYVEYVKGTKASQCQV